MNQNASQKQQRFQSQKHLYMCIVKIKFKLINNIKYPLSLSIILLVLLTLNHPTISYSMNTHNTYDDQQSDNQTVTQTQTIQQPIVTLEYLLNQNKMKQIALSKATHLIQLYKIQLQVKQQDYLKELEIIKQTQKDNYEGLISQLEDKTHRVEKQLRQQKQHYQDVISQLEEKILKLEKQLKMQEVKITEYQKRNSEHYELQKLNESGCRIPKMSRNNSGRDLSNNRKGRYSQTKNLSNPNPQGSSNMRRSLSTFVSNQALKEIDLYRIEKTFLIQFLLSSEQKDEKIITQLQNQLTTESQLITQTKSSIKVNQKFMQQFLKLLKQPSAQMQSKLKEYKEIIKIQELIIEELNGQLYEYQDLFNVMNASLDEVFYQQNHQPYLDEVRFSISTTANSIARNQQTFEDFRNIIDETQANTMAKIRQHKSFIRQKVVNMQAQNKELKRIMDDMIKLIKNNKKIQALSFGNIRNARTAEDLQYSKEKTKSQTLYRK